ncbi:hypothetical protein LSTR_LSTR012349, partial [Laodelphax striatellus]
ACFGGVDFSLVDTVMFDSERFIESVRERPTLWNKHHTDYLNKSARHSCWCAVGEVMYDDWPALDNDETNLRIMDMKNKWRNIRDSFTRYVKSDAPADKKKKYVHADALMFLLDTMEGVSTLVFEGDTRPVNSIEEVDLSTDSAIAHCVTEIVNYEIEDDIPPPRKSARQGLRNRNSKMTSSSTNTKITSSTKNSQMTSSDSEQPPLPQPSCSYAVEEDPDRLYILSLLADYKKLDEDDKLEFKLDYVELHTQLTKHQSQTGNGSFGMGFAIAEAIAQCCCTPQAAQHFLGITER